MKTCKIETCERKHYARDLCNLHYQRWMVLQEEMPDYNEDTRLSVVAADAAWK